VSGLVALLLAVGAFSLSQTGRLAAGREPSVAVPGLVGSTRAEAETKLRTVGLTARYQEVAGPAGATVGRVTGQTPQAGVEVTGDSVVTVQVNAGPNTATIPTGLVGADVDDVRERLVRLGFRNVRTQRDPDPGDAGPGEVLAIDPPAGTPVALTRAVVISYADQREPTTAPPDSDDSSGPSSTRSTAPASPEASESSRPPTTPPSVPPTSATTSSVAPTTSASSTTADPGPNRPSATGRGQSRSSAPGPGKPSNSGNGSGDDQEADDEKDDDKKDGGEKSEDDKKREDEAKDTAAADAARRG
jgi:serine/threonine-protein kinase